MHSSTSSIFSIVRSSRPDERDFISARRDSIRHFRSARCRMKLSFPLLSSCLSSGRPLRNFEINLHRDCPSRYGKIEKQPWLHSLHFETTTTTNLSMGLASKLAAAGVQGAPGSGSAPPPQGQSSGGYGQPLPQTPQQSSGQYGSSAPPPYGQPGKLPVQIQTLPDKRRESCRGGEGK